MQSGKATLEECREALSLIDAHSRETWVQMGMAIKSEFGEAGFDVWNRWSATAENYNAKDAITVWRSFREHGGTTIGSLFFVARENGYKGSSFTPQNKPTPIRDIRMKEKEIKAKQEAAANVAMGIFQNCKGGKNHPYMISKGLGDETVLIDDKGNMVVPMMSSPGELSAVQLISPEGKKLFQPRGCKTSGTFFSIGNIMRPTHIWICEGVATGYTMHKVLRDEMKRENDAVVICFSGSNMKKVANKFKKEKADGFTQIKDVFVVADMDQPICPKTKKNVPLDNLKNHHPISTSFRCQFCKQDHSWCETYGLNAAMDTKLSFICSMNYGSDINDVFQEAQENKSERQNLFLSEFFEMVNHSTDRSLDEGYEQQPLITGKIGDHQVGLRKYHINGK